jgi:putative ATPase
VARSRPSPLDSEPDLLSVDRDALRPLAERMRPRTLDEMVGQRRLLAPGSAVRRAIESGRVHSMILWGPPGCGKTTLAQLLARYADAEFRAVSAVLVGLPEVRQVLAEAGHRFAEGGARCCSSTRCIASTRRSRMPSCRTSSGARSCSSARPPRILRSNSIRALLSRCRVHVMDAVSPDDIVVALQRRWTMPSAAWAACAAGSDATTPARSRGAPTATCGAR